MPSEFQAAKSMEIIKFLRSYLEIFKRKKDDTEKTWQKRSEIYRETVGKKVSTKVVKRCTGGASFETNTKVVEQEKKST